MPNKIKHLYEFGDFIFDAESLVLTHSVKEVHLPPKASEMLKVLLENHGEIVGRDILLETIWEDAFVEDSNLTVTVSQLRKTLSQYDKKSAFVETLPKRGYRFAGEVNEILEETDDAPLIVERHTLERLTVEEYDDSPKQIPALEPAKTYKKSNKNRIFAALAVIAGLILVSIFIGQYYLTKPDKQIESLAVLPLKNLTESEENKTLSLGLTDNLISRLGSLNQFTVRPLSAVTKFDRSGKDAVKFGADLQVDAVLAGTIQTVDDRLRVNIRLLNVKDGSQIWEGSFDETESDIFKLQDALSEQVANSITSHLTKDEQRKLTANLTENPEAYDAYLKGRYFWSRRTRDDLLKAIDYFKKAVELDPNFAEAYVGLADSQFLLFDYRWDNSLENPQTAKKNLLKALSIKSDLAAALSTLGLIQTTLDWDWQAAENSFKRAIAIEPKSPQTLLRYGSLLVRLRRFSEAQEMLAKARKLDPLSVGINMNHAVSFLHAKNLETAENQLKETLEIAPNFTPARWYLARCYWQQGKKDEAVAEFIKALEENDEIATAAKMRQTAGVTEKIRVWREDWRKKFDREENDAHDMAIVSAFLNDKEAALFYLEKSVKHHDAWASWIYSEPEFDFVRGEPRFAEIMKKMNFDTGN